MACRLETGLQCTLMTFALIKIPHLFNLFLLFPWHGLQVGKPIRLAAHFDDMLNAFLTVFIIITCDNWTNIMFPMMSVSVMQLCTPYTEGFATGHDVQRK